MLLSDLNFGVIFKQKQTNITAGNTELIAWIEIFVQVGKLYSIAWVTIAPTEEPKRFVSTTSMCVDSRPTVIIYDLSKHYEEGSFVNSQLAFHIEVRIANLCLRGFRSIEEGAAFQTIQCLQSLGTTFQPYPLDCPPISRYCYALAV